jgi:hypothetical protein
MSGTEVHSISYGITSQSPRNMYTNLYFKYQSKTARCAGNYAGCVTFLAVLTQSLKSDDSGTENNSADKIFNMRLKSQ